MLTSNPVSNRKFVVGDYVTYVDFMLYEAIDINALDFNRLFVSGSRFQIPKVLLDYLNRIEELPQLADYFANLKRFPIMRSWATWAGSEKN